MGLKTLCFGAVLWDIIEKNDCIGGAPLNFGAHLARLGWESYIITKVGRDVRGNKAVTIMKNLGINVSLVQIGEEYPTGIVEVKMLDEGIPSYVIQEEVSYDFIEINSTLIDFLKKKSFDVFYFGTLEQRTVQNRKSLYKILNIIKAKNIFYDVNFRQNYYSKQSIETSLKYCTILKLNDEEMQILKKLLYGTEMYEEEFINKLSSEYFIDTVCITRGKNGCTIFNKGVFKNYSSIKTNVVDTVGAGDAFSAAFINQYCKTKDFFKSGEIANLLGAYVVSKRGATPEYNKEIESILMK